MKALLNLLLEGVKNLVQPAALGRLLNEHPEMRVSLEGSRLPISAASVVRWHELGSSSSYSSRFCYERGVVLGWRYQGDSYQSFELFRPEYLQMGQRSVIEHWSCDISDVHGFSASKSDLLAFNSTDAMAEAKSPDLIDAITPEKLAMNLAHKGIRIVNQSGADYFALHQWDGRLFLMNDDGSHHFAAAKYIAARLPRSVTLRGKLYIYSLNATAIASLRHDFEMFVIPKAPAISMEFFEAMKAFRVTWLEHDMPYYFRTTKAILLPRNEPRSMQVAAILKKAGIVDLGAHLADLAAKRRAKLTRLQG